MKIVGSTSNSNNIIELDNAELCIVLKALNTPEVDNTPEKTEVVVKKNKKLEEFFAEKNLEIVSCKSKSEIDKSNRKIAQSIWNFHSISLPFLKEMLKKKSGEEFTYDLTTLAPPDVVNLNNFCNNLARKMWIKDYKKSKKSLQFTLAEDFNKSARQFLNGAWAELVNLHLLETVLQEFAKQNDGLKYNLFYDVKLRKIGSENTTDIQLDLVVQLPGSFLIFETKSGRNLNIIKWAENHTLFTHDRNYYITCNTDENLDPHIFRPGRLFTIAKLQQQFTCLLQNILANKQC